MNFPRSPFYIIGKLIVNYIFFIIQYIKSFNAPPLKKPIEIPYVETQYDKTCKKYANFYNTETPDENSNIDPVLYDFEKRKEIFVSPDNEMEKQWKSRILIENTPRGNVMMYFNPYLLSYQYYSDEQIIPYKILEQVATRYVVMFRCKDFFIDVEKRPRNQILDVLQKEEDSLKSKKMKVNDITKCVNIQSDSKDVFAALKDYRSEVTKAEPAKAEATKAEATKESTKEPNGSSRFTKETKTKAKLVKRAEEPKFSNKFVRVGKMCEFNITQKPVNKKIEAVNELMFGTKPVNKVVDFFDDLEIVDMPEDEPISAYQMFKKQQQLNMKAT
jgi:hypothetical protein